MLGCWYHRLLDRVFSGACFLTGGVLECDLSHRRFVSVLCMLYKIRSNPIHPLCGALPVPFVPVWVTHGTFVAHRQYYSHLRCRTSQCHRTFLPDLVSLWNNHVDSVFDGVGLEGFKSRVIASLLTWAALFLFFSFLFFSPIGLALWVVVLGLIVYRLFPALQCGLLKIITNTNNN